MTKKIPLAIDTKPLAQAIDKSVRRTMTKAIICVIEGALVALAAVISWRMVVTIVSM